MNRPTREEVEVALAMADDKGARYVTWLAAEVRALREEVIDLRGWTCESCYDTNRHHCRTCIAAG